MKKSDKDKIDTQFLKGLGRRINLLILQKGYVSPYEFWIERSDALFSRAALHYILIGKADPKITTLRAIAEGLEITLQELLGYEDKAPRYIAPED